MSSARHNESSCSKTYPCNTVQGQKHAGIYVFATCMHRYKGLSKNLGKLPIITKFQIQTGFTQTLIHMLVPSLVKTGDRVVTKTMHHIPDKNGFSVKLIGATGANAPKILICHYFLTWYPPAKFHPNWSNFHGDIYETGFTISMDWTSLIMSLTVIRNALTNLTLQALQLPYQVHEYYPCESTYMYASAD